MNEQSIPIDHVNFRHVSSVIDWRGKTTKQDQLICPGGIEVAPTVLCLDKDGKAIASRLMSGASTSDFYVSYLEERIRTTQMTISHDSSVMK